MPLRKPPGSDSRTAARAGFELQNLESKVARAAGSPLVRGGLTIVAGIVTGNILGFFRVALTAFLLGTHSAADSLAVAMGPIDTVNISLINAIVFAFVPMLTERSGPARIALFLELRRLFTRFFFCVTAAVFILAPQLIAILAPGLPEAYVGQAVTLLRIGSLSTVAVGVAAIHSALLYTGRRFAPSAFHQATLNVFTIVGALSLWKIAGVYCFAIGYVAGASCQLAMVYWAARSELAEEGAHIGPVPWREIISKPASILAYSVFLSLNITATRAFATQAGPGAAAALDYCMRCIGVPLTFLISPISNSLLPEIARLRSLFRLPEAFRLIDRTLAVAGLAAVAACAIGVAVRTPVISLLFERGSFTPESTRLVAAVFLGFAPSLIGGSLFELTARALFALDRPWLPLAASTLPVVCNLAVLLSIPLLRPELVGLGASAGLLVAFAFLFAMAHARRAQWMAEK
ncbi:MAG TPA: lipid II flippase MurJ [Bryobacteraceae bacterium]|nr:lipid II flippase MurJ [Bryobacteraceae bacterium]